MSQSDLERLAAKVRAINQQLSDDAATLAGFERKADELAARAVAVTRGSARHDLVALPEVFRDASNSVRDAMASLAAAAAKGREYEAALRGGGTGEAAVGAPAGEFAPAPTPEAASAIDGEPGETTGRSRRSGKPRSGHRWTNTGGRHRQFRRRSGKYRKLTMRHRIGHRLFLHGTTAATLISSIVRFGPSPWVIGSAVAGSMFTEGLERYKRQGKDAGR